MRVGLWRMRAEVRLGPEQSAGNDCADDRDMKVNPTGEEVVGQPDKVSRDKSKITLFGADFNTRRGLATRLTSSK